MLRAIFMIFMGLVSALVCGLIYLCTGQDVETSHPNTFSGLSL